MFRKAIIILLILLSHEVLGEDEETTTASANTSSTAEIAMTTVSSTSTSETATTASLDSTASTPSPASTASTTTNPNVTTTTAIPTTTIPFPADLADCTAYQNWFNTTEGRNYTMRSGYYMVNDPSNAANRILLFCDFFTDGGYWTAIQVRSEDEVEQEFKNRNYSEYAQGFFTNTNGPSSYWVGFDRIEKLLQDGQTSLRIDMTTCGGAVFSAVYDNFQIGSEANGYNLTSATYVASLSNAGDALFNSNANYNLINRKFYTENSYDKISDGRYNCAELFGGGWWYNLCGLSNLNGIHYPGCYYSALFTDGIRWGTNWSGYYSPNRVEMKLRNPTKAPPTTPAAPTPAGTGETHTSISTAAEIATTTKEATTAVTDEATTLTTTTVVSL
uniref:Fibrinogen C-terminal domain-containing protein n=1 Tax=Plectus sambesii TaxID=2011161 RepID=A0A914WM56_9BILA